MSEPIKSVEAAVREHGALPMPAGATALTDEQRAAIAELIGDAKPATTGLVQHMAKAVHDRATHEHPTWEDLYCLNLVSWLGERMAPVLRRLLDAEARVAELEAERHVTNAALADVTEALRAAQAPTVQEKRDPRGCSACGSLPETWCPDCAACEQGCFGGFDGNSCSHSKAKWGGTQ